jgi:hypothetical protein
MKMKIKENDEKLNGNKSKEFALQMHKRVIEWQ